MKNQTAKLSLIINIATFIQIYNALATKVNSHSKKPIKRVKAKLIDIQIIKRLKNI